MNYGKNLSEAFEIIEKHWLKININKELFPGWNVAARFHIGSE